MADNEISEYYAGERPELVAFLKPAGRFAQVLEIGCAAGYFAAGLTEQSIAGACDGIEPQPEAAQLARGRLRQVWNGTLETVAGEVPWRQYDLVVMADVLEHLADPWAALRLLAQQTGDACKLALSVPNVRHYKVVLPLLFRGEFRYQDYGIMDRTHLHFFTKSSLTETLWECGWKVQRIAPHMKSRFRKWKYPTRLIEPFVAVQYMLLAEKR